MWASGVLKGKAKGNRKDPFFFSGNPEDAGQREKKRGSWRGPGRQGGDGSLCNVGKERAWPSGSHAASGSNEESSGEGFPRYEKSVDRQGLGHWEQKREVSDAKWAGKARSEERFSGEWRQGWS